MVSRLGPTVPEIQQSCGASAMVASGALLPHLDRQIVDSLAQSVAVEPKDLCRAQLVASGRRQREGNEGPLDFGHDPFEQTVGRRAVRLAREIADQVFMNE